MKFKSEIYTATKSNLRLAQKEIRQLATLHFQVDCTHNLPRNSIVLFGEFEQGFLPYSSRGDEKLEWVLSHLGKKFYLETVDLKVK